MREGPLEILTLAVLLLQGAKGVDDREPLPAGSVVATFLVSVNDTMELCLATVPTPQLVNGKTYNETEPINVGTCDKGKLTFTVNMGSTDHVSKMDVVVTFYTHIILAMPPTCTIPWNGTYLELHTSNISESPLPTCFVSNSQEGYHTMYYWFRLLDWTLIFSSTD